MKLSAKVLRLFEACARAGGRALAVGGAVRDFYRGEQPKDIDVEVHGLAPAALESTLASLGRVDEVGKSFGVYKLRLGGDELDVSLPRRDSQAGLGHKGIRAEPNPFLGVVEAARRRDLTINAIAWDPLAGVFEDPFEGRADIDARLLRAVDPRTFVEDPLRALRVAQFVGRFDFGVHPELLALCATMHLNTLPSERIWGEVHKLLTRSPRPSAGWQFAHEAGLWRQVVPEWNACPEALDRVAQLAVRPPPRRLALLLAAAGASQPVLERLNLHRLDGYRLREQVLALLRPRRLTTDADLRHAAEHVDLELLFALHDLPDAAIRAATLGVLHGPLPPLLQGKDLVALGYVPGPALGEALARVRQAQLDGQIGSSNEARALLLS